MTKMNALKDMHLVREHVTLLLLIALTGFLPFRLGAQAPRLQVVASASMISDMAYQIAGEWIDIETIVPIGGDPHLHEPTPRDARIVAAADLILINGLTFEGWITELIENSGTKGRITVVTEGVEPLRSLNYKNSTDPHAWMDAKNGLIYARNICLVLKEMLPEHEEKIQIRFDEYAKEISALDDYIRTEIAKIPEQQRILITSHDAFQYYGRSYGVRLEAIMGISTEAEAQTSDLLRVRQSIEENQVPAIFMESTINPKLIEQIARDTRIIIGGKLYADSLGDKDSPAPSYIQMLRYNTDTIVKSLSGKSAETQIQENQFRGIHMISIALAMIAGLVLIIFKINRNA